jgi:hypothetical protein
MNNILAREHYNLLSSIISEGLKVQKKYTSTPPFGKPEKLNPKKGVLKFIISIHH